MAKRATISKPTSKRQKPDRLKTRNTERRRYKKVIDINPVTIAPPSALKYCPEFAEQAYKLCRLGATDWDIAEFFEVNTTTIWRWQARYPEFHEALKRAKDAADDRVERSLYSRATGYTFDSVKVMNVDGEVVKVPIIEHVPPEVTACIFWLKNRRPAEWRDKTDHDHNHSHVLNLQGGQMSIEEAQQLFRQARNSTPNELERTLKTIEGKVLKKESAA